MLFQNNSKGDFKECSQSISGKRMMKNSYTIYKERGNSRCSHSNTGYIDAVTKTKTVPGCFHSPAGSVHRLLPLMFYTVLLLAPALNVAWASKSRAFPFVQLIRQNHLSFEWVDMQVQSAALLSQITQPARSASFFNQHLVQLDFHRDWLNILNLFHWGFSVGAGMSFGGGRVFTPLYTGSVLSLHLGTRPWAVPFVSSGYALWAMEWQQFSSLILEWNAGVNLSFAIFKPSLGYTLSDEYGIEDMGVVVKTTSYYSTKDFWPEGDKVFSSLHVGAYFRF